MSRKLSRAFLILLISLGVSIQTGLVANAATQVIEKGPCKGIGQVSQVKKIKFLCTKVGGKKVWIKAASKKAVSKSTPVLETSEANENRNTNQPASDPTEGGACTPNSKLTLGFAIKPGLRIYLRCDVSTSKYVPYEQIANPEPDLKTIEDLSAYPAYFHVAWKKVRDQAEGDFVVPVNVNVRVGPSTSFYNTNIQETMKRATTLYRNYPQPKKFELVAYNFDDIAWAENEVRKIRDQQGVVDSVRSFCPSKESCTTAGALGILNDVGLIVAASKSSSDFYFTSGGLDIHEYTHLVQSQVASKGRYEPSKGPCWFQEAQAMFNGVAAASKEFADYKDLRNWYISQGGVGRYTEPQNILDYLNENINKSCAFGDQKLAGFGYSVGALIVEALTAIHGPDASMQVFDELSKGKSFEEAFEISYKAPIGKILKEVAPLIAQQFVLRLGTG